jgi:hypothetical protein
MHKPLKLRSNLAGPVQPRRDCRLPSGVRARVEQDPPAMNEMNYEKPRFMALNALSEIQATEKCLCAVLEGGPPYLYVSSPNAYESDE